MIPPTDSFRRRISGNGHGWKWQGSGESWRCFDCMHARPDPCVARGQTNQAAIDRDPCPPCCPISRICLTARRNLQSALARTIPQTAFLEPPNLATKPAPPAALLSTYLDRDRRGTQQPTKVRVVATVRPTESSRVLAGPLGVDMAGLCR